MKVEINVSHNCGYRSLSFTKTYDMNFAPFLGMYLCDETDDGDENIVEFANHKYHSTTIWYYDSKKSFLIDVRENWAYIVSDETITNTISSFTATGWKLKSSEKEVKEMRDWMAKEREKQTK